MTETNCSKFKKHAAALAVASCLSVMPWVAEAAGLGRLTVFSGLGQPLRAELEIVASKNELAGMAAHLAPPDAFTQVGIDYAGVLRDLRFSVEKRGKGKAIVKVTSLRPINDPFIDMLVELNWPTGRLVREYTFLLDPPEYSSKSTSAPVSTAEAKLVETQRGGGKMASQTALPAKAASASSPKIAEKSGKENSADTHVVKTGETLRKIATESQYQGVSLEQMLVGLFQRNPDAFSGKNINRLKAGAILTVPEKSSVEAVSPVEAKKMYLAHARDWNAYRQKLAASAAKAPASEEAAIQTTSGKITAKVEEKATPAEQAKDQVKVSRSEAGKKSEAASELDLIAKNKALKEAQERLVLLEKNVDELQKLLEMKNKKLAELQQPAVKKEEAKPVEPAKVIEPPKPIEEAKPVEESKPVEVPAVAEVAKPAEVETPIEPPKPVEAKVAEVPKPAEPSTDPDADVDAEQPGFVDALLDNPLPLLGGGGILALLAAFFLIKRRPKQEAASQETTAAPSPSSLGPNSVFRMTGGQSIDTANVSLQTGEFSQTGPGSIDTDEVDPVAEADVYMAYGRDTQAEEILLEALQKDPQRTAIHAKLLEIYANRKSVKQFETLASELYAQTGGVGPDWGKVAELGASLDPANPLYSGSQSVAPAAFDATKTLTDVVLPKEIVTSEAEASSDQVLDFSPEELNLSEPEAPLREVIAEEINQGPAANFELPAEPVIELPAEADEPYIDTVVTGESNALDFDLGGAEEPAAEPANEEAPKSELSEEIIDFDLGPVAEATANEQLEPAAHVSPDFSPEGTMVLSSSGKEEIAPESTYIGVDSAPLVPVEEAETASEEATQQLGDLDFELDASTQTVVNAAPGGFSSEDYGDLAAEISDADSDAKLAETVIGPDPDSLEFDVKLTDSVFLGQPMMPPDFDIGSINLDLTSPASPEPATVAETSSELEPPVAEDVPKDTHWEQVNTKLELAKAYEEMGDLEGARELLQEVVGEGSADLVEQARAVLGRIGE